MEQKGQQIQHHLDSVTTDLQVILGDKFTDSVMCGARTFDGKLIFS